MSEWSLTSGCFDMLHVGHIRFLEQASHYGRLFVAVASDSTIQALKGRRPEIGEEERLEMIRSLRSVAQAEVSPGKGLMDFSPLLNQVSPKRLIVNYDGDIAEKRQICESRGIEYIVLDQRSGPHTSSLRQRCRIPYRIDLAGGWLDQPFVSQLHSGAVIVASIEPLAEYNTRSGLATSTRLTAQQLWGSRLPCTDPLETARMLFGSENPPGTTEVSGSQDALGICLPGVHRLEYEGEYWPKAIEPVVDIETLHWLSRHLRLIESPPRSRSISVLDTTNVSKEGVKSLADAADQCWASIMNRDELELGKSISDCYHAQSAMFPLMQLNQWESVRAMPDVLGAKVCGAGGGGYILAVCRSNAVLGVPVSLRYACE